MNATERLTALAEWHDGYYLWYLAHDGGADIAKARQSKETAAALRALIPLIAEHETAFKWMDYSKRKEAESALAQWRKSDG